MKNWSPSEWLLFLGGIGTLLGVVTNMIVAIITATHVTQVKENTQKIVDGMTKDKDEALVKAAKLEGEKLGEMKQQLKENLLNTQPPNPNLGG